MKKRVITLTALFFIAITVTGCISVNGEFASIRNHLLENSDVKYHRDIELMIGPGLLAMAGAFVTFADENQAAEIIREVKRVQVGIYKPENRGDFRCTFDVVKKLSDEMREKGWYYIVRTTSGNEAAAVFVRDRKGIPKELMVVSVDDEEMVLVQLYGNLGKIVASAVKERGLGIDHKS